MQTQVILVVTAVVVVTAGRVYGRACRGYAGALKELLTWSLTRVRKPTTRRAQAVRRRASTTVLRQARNVGSEVVLMRRGSTQEAGPGRTR